jgi:hypothetical protein
MSISREDHWGPCPPDFLLRDQTASNCMFYIIACQLCLAPDTLDVVYVILIFFDDGHPPSANEHTIQSRPPEKNPILLIRPLGDSSCPPIFILPPFSPHPSSPPIPVCPAVTAADHRPM